MDPIIVQSQWKGFRVNSLTPDYVLDVRPEDGYPRGREAKELSDLWVKLRDADIPGLLLLGCDVAADPDDYAAMAAAASRTTGRVLTGMVKLWPASTGRKEWMWSHRGGTLGNPVASQYENTTIAYFSLGFLWVPRKLLDIAFPAYDNWQWGEMDVKLSELAYRNYIPVHAVHGARPKHLHFTDEHNI